MSVSLILIGNRSLAQQCAEIALARGNEIAALMTTDAAVRDWAQAKGLHVVGSFDALTGISADWLLSIANLSIIPEAVLALPRQGAVNFHDGPLPRHAGLNAPVWAMLEGETHHGISWHMIEGGVDEGDVLVSRAFDITARDSALTLNTKAYAAAMDSFPTLMEQLESGALNRNPQDLSRRSYHPLGKRPEAHGLLDLTRPGAELKRLVQALDHGPYWNPIALPKLWVNGRALAVRSLDLIKSSAAPGTVLESGTSVTIACGDGAVVLGGLTPLDGGAFDAPQALRAGMVLTPPDSAAIDRAVAQVSRSEAFWRKALAAGTPVTLPESGTGTKGALTARPLALAGAAEPAFAALAQQLAGRQPRIAYAHEALSGLAASGMIAPWVPITCPGETALAAGQSLTDAMQTAAAKGGFLSDLPLRDPDLTAVMPALGLSHHGAIEGCALTLDLSVPQLLIDTARLDADEAERLALRLETLAQVDFNRPVSDLPTLSEPERDSVLNQWNATATDQDRALTLHRAFEAQAARTPDACALIFEDQRLSYAELNARANRTAHRLVQDGVTPGDIVGLCATRSPEMLVGALAILKAGAAYLPMDPSYPADRLLHMLRDSQARLILTNSQALQALPPETPRYIVVDGETATNELSAGNLPDTALPEDLAYLIYTSGSTGKPKGVMVEHRNVLNFFTGMDAVIPQGGTWLAVTSLSFDISVLELFWTTARGFTVVLTGDEDRGLISKGPMPRGASGMEFSLYYWGNDDGAGRDKYGLLLEGAKFADENGFVAVWTPERHFHAFGGPYPNPSVTGAAVAGATQNIGVRAGSVVAPLHHPARIAEEWAVIDNLTNGRAGMALASGWQPDDFVLRPENTPPENKPALMRDLDIVRKLWRGEAVGFPRKDGTLHEVVTQPRPVSKELPVWITTAGNPQTWKDAGAAGCNVLTHLLGQSIDEVGEKIKLYHAALREAGHDPAKFSVTLMLHTYLAETRDTAREIAREPMKDYLRSAAGLIKQYAWAFPAFKRPEGAKNAFDLQLDGLEPDELDAILDFAFERYFNDSGLFGTPEDAIARSAELQQIGVTEIACLIDYGIDRQTVLDGLRPLAQVVQACAAAPELDPQDFSIAAQIVRHGVTHLQCTPSMARMIAMNDEARYALRGVQHLYFGGEPLPGALVAEFAKITKASITNMYGPTETTIWSSTQVANASEPVMNIGLPLANQQLYVLDDARQPVAIGAEGELWIGGEGVTRGYWQRPELTAQRFVDNPFHGGRMYATGDLVRRRADGAIAYVGRVDHQVKLRGHRIELGEIEACLETIDGITQAVVSAREDQPGDTRLVGYYTGAAQPEDRLKATLKAALPAIMVPSHLVHLEAFPLTPNKKVDRGALPAPQPVSKPAPKPVPQAAPQPGARDGKAVLAQLSRIWQDTLGVTPAPADNFFDLGGHSLLAVQAHRAIRDQLGAADLSITDIFRFPVLGDLAGRVAALVGDAPAPASAEPTALNPRAQSRSDAMARRREMRARRRA